MLRLAVLLLSSHAAAALQVQPGARMLRTAARPALSVSMGEASTKKPNEWKYVKGINDYGKEQTYMTLGENTSEKFAYDPLGFADDPTLSLIWQYGWAIALFTPFTLTAIYVVARTLGLVG